MLPFLVTVCTITLVLVCVLIAGSLWFWPLTLHSQLQWMEEALGSLSGIGTGPDQGVPRRFDEISPLEPHARTIRPGEPLALRMEYKGPQEDVSTTNGGRTVQVAGDLHDQRGRTQPDSFLETGTGGGLLPSVNRVVNPGAAADARNNTRELSHPGVRHQFDTYRAGVVSGNGSEPGNSGYGRIPSTGHGPPDAEDQEVPRPPPSGAGTSNSPGHGAKIGLPHLAGGGENPRSGIEVGPYRISNNEMCKKNFWNICWDTVNIH